MQVSRGTLAVEVSYAATLDGDVVGEVPGVEWISAYASEAAPVKSVVITQSVGFGFYTMDTVRLVDPATGAVLHAEPRRSLSPG